jgi:hypothetical protein
MTERPIIFSAPMVRAILEGRKTQTRRVLKPQPSQVSGSNVWFDWQPGKEPPKPYCKPGDMLWVRETIELRKLPGNIFYSPVYRADGAHVMDGAHRASNHEFMRHLVHSPIHMPRWASRITLIVEDVRVQRLQDISEEDAMAEGVDAYLPGHGCATEVEARALRAEGYPYSPSYRDGFGVLWTTIHGPGAWDANPWVAAITFRRQA